MRWKASLVYASEMNVTLRSLRDTKPSPSRMEVDKNERGLGVTDNEKVVTDPLWLTESILKLVPQEKQQLTKTALCFMVNMANLVKPGPRAVGTSTTISIHFKGAW